MKTLWSDIRLTFRTCAKRKAFTAVVVLTVGLGVGANAAIFSIVNALLFHPLPVRQPDRLVMVSAIGERRFLEQEPVAYADYVDYRRENRSFSDMAAYRRRSAVIGRGEVSEIVIGEEVTANYFDVLGTRPYRGRFLKADEDASSDATPALVLGYSTWKGRFSGDEHILGQSLTVNGIPHIIIGVAPAEFTGLFRGIVPEFWIPLISTRGTHEEQSSLNDRGVTDYWAVGRLKDGVSAQQAQDDLAATARALRSMFPNTNARRDVAVKRLDEASIHPAVSRATVVTTSAAIMSLSGIVLLIACANLANLLLIQALARRKEVAIRLSLGSSRSRLIRQLLTEHIVLALIGGAVALIVATASNRLLDIIQLPVPVQIALNLHVDLRVAVFTFILSIFTGIVFALAPIGAALKVDIIGSLKDEAAASSGSRQKTRLRRTLVVAQMAASLALLLVAGLAVRSLGNAYSINPGFDADRIVVVSLAPSLAGYDAAHAQLTFQALGERIRAIRGIESTSYAQPLPLTLQMHLARLQLPDSQSNSNSRGGIPFVDTAVVWPDYFRTMGVAILQGREFSPADRESSLRVAIVNQAFAKKYWQNRTAVGKQVSIGFPVPLPVTIVGVAKDGKYRTLADLGRPFIYTCGLQDPAAWESPTLIARTTGDPAKFTSAIRTAIATADRNMPVYGAQTLNQQIGISLILPKYVAAIFGAFGLLGFVLAILGLYGVMSYSVAQRTREIGIRIALGGRHIDVLVLVVGQGLKLTFIGVTVGLALGFLLARLLAAVLYGVTSMDAPTLVEVSAIMLAAGAIAAYVPARRATRIDPIAALHYE